MIAQEIPPGPGLLSPPMLFLYGSILIGAVAVILYGRVIEWRDRVDWEAHNLTVSDCEELLPHVKEIYRLLKSIEAQRWGLESAMEGRNGFAHKMNLTIEHPVKDREMGFTLSKGSVLPHATEGFLETTLEETSSLLAREISFFMRWCLKNDGKARVSGVGEGR